MHHAEYHHSTAHVYLYLLNNYNTSVSSTAPSENIITLFGYIAEKKPFKMKPVNQIRSNSRWVVESIHGVFETKSPDICQHRVTISHQTK